MWSLLGQFLRKNQVSRPQVIAVCTATAHNFIYYDGQERLKSETILPHLTIKTNMLRLHYRLVASTPVVKKIIALAS